MNKKLLKELSKGGCTAESDPLQGLVWIFNKERKKIFRGSLDDLLRKIGAPCMVDWGI